MKPKNVAWFDSEVDKICQSIRDHRQILLSDLESSPTFCALEKASRYTQGLGRCSYSVVCLLLSLSLVLIAKYNWLWSAEPRDTNCLIRLPDSMLNAFVPPNRCDFCRNLTSIERVQHLSADDFTKKYAYSKVPVIIIDAMVNWTARHVFSYEYFRRLYTETALMVSGVPKKSCQFFPYKTEFGSLQEAFQMDPSRANYSAGSKPWYIGWSNCDYSIANQLRRHYEKPYFLPADSESIRTDWIFMGTPNNGAHMHIDHVGRPSWQAQIRGKKRWFLEPPLECYTECSDHLVDVDQGHIIVLDTNVWYHKTLILGDQVSITIGAEFD